MKHLLKRIAGCLLIAGLALASPVLADDDNEEKVQLKDCPEAVQATLKKHLDNGTILEIEKETAKDGTVTYEAEVKRQNGTVFEIEVSSNGKLIEIEEEDDEEDED